jgi:hypothetical protein
MMKICQQVRPGRGWTGSNDYSNGGIGPDANYSEDRPAAPDAGRTSEFGVGSGAYSSAHASVLEDHSPTPSLPFRPEGVLQQFQHSANGMSAQDASRRFIGQNMPGPSFNGAAPQQQEQLQNLRAIGDSNA